MTIDPPATLTGQPYAAPSVPTIKLRVADSSVKHARDTTARMLADLVPTGHLDEVKLVASELVTNALRAAREHAQRGGWMWQYDDAPVHLTVTCGALWTRIDVRDPDPRPLVIDSGGLLDESGRGLALVAAVAAKYWVTYEVDPLSGEDFKAIHAVVPMPGAALGEAELAEATA